MRDMKTEYINSAALWAAIDEHELHATDDVMRSRIEAGYDYAVGERGLDPDDDASEILLFLEDFAVSGDMESCCDKLISGDYDI